jgi:hypothetical protein
MIDITVHGYTGLLYISEAEHILSLALELAAETDSPKARQLAQVMQDAGFAYDERFAGAFD